MVKEIIFSKPKRKTKNIENTKNIIYSNGIQKLKGNYEQIIQLKTDFESKLKENKY